MIDGLKDYQEIAVREIKEDIERYLSRGRNKTIVFKSPTGSGKTLMASTVIEQLVEEHQNKNFCFLWTSIGTGELHKQSYESVNTYTKGYPTCSLLETTFFGTRDYIKNHEVVFVNWEKLVSKDSKTGKWLNNLMKDQEYTSLREVINNTKIMGTKIILIVDESHIGVNEDTRIAEFKNDIIKADLTLEMSATPSSDPDILVEVEDVVDEGMIKEGLIVNDGIRKDDVSNIDKDSEMLVLEHAEDKRQEIIKNYSNYSDKDINPLVLVQIPNVEAGEAKKQVVKDFLREIEITEENGKLKIWTSESNDFDKKSIRKNDDKTCYLVFKTAVATGWDCPRAHILVKFREGHSETFEIQTIGRILRTAEAKRYKNTVLDNAYIYTNIKEFETKQGSYDPNRIKTEISYIKKPYDKDIVFNQTKLTSYYRSRKGDYNSADSRITKYFEKYFMTFFDLKEKDKGGCPLVNKSKLEVKGLEITIDRIDSMIEETNIDTEDLSSENIITGDQASVQMSETDIQSSYYNLIKENLNGLAYVRSRSPINAAIIGVFSEFYNAFDRKDKVSSIQRIVVNNASIFAEILHDATQDFKNSLEGQNVKKGAYSDFYIEEKRAYSVETHKELKSKKSLYQPFHVFITDKGTKAINELEKSFIEYLETEGKEYVEWFWQNGQEHMQTNFGIPYDNGAKTFQPDFLVKFNNNTVGIFDTKASGQYVKDTKDKAEALFKYILEKNSSRNGNPKLIGGIVIKQGSQFYYYNESVYHDIAEDKENWTNFNKLYQ